MRRPKWLESKEKSIREVRNTQTRPSEIDTGYPLSIQLGTDQHMYVRKLPKARGKKTPEKIRFNSGHHSHRARNSICPHQPDWKTCFKAYWVKYTKGSCLSRRE